MSLVSLLLCLTSLAVKNIFLMPNQCFPHCSLCPLPLVPKLCSSEKSLALCSPVALLQVEAICRQVSPDPSHPFFVLDKPRSSHLSLSYCPPAPNHYSGPSLDSLVVWQEPCCAGMSKRDPVLQMHLHECPADGHHPLPHLLALLLQPAVGSPFIMHC